MIRRVLLALLVPGTALLAGILLGAGALSLGGLAGCVALLAEAWLLVELVRLEVERAVSRHDHQTIRATSTVVKEAGRRLRLAAHHFDEAARGTLREIRCASGGRAVLPSRHGGDT